MNTLYEYPNILDEGMNILLLVDGELALGNINYAKRPSCETVEDWLNLSTLHKCYFSRDR